MFQVINYLRQKCCREDHINVYAVNSTLTGQRQQMSDHLMSSKTETENTVPRNKFVECTQSRVKYSL